MHSSSSASSPSLSSSSSVAQDSSDSSKRNNHNSSSNSTNNHNFNNSGSTSNTTNSSSSGSNSGGNNNNNSNSSGSGSNINNHYVGDKESNPLALTPSQPRQHQDPRRRDSSTERGRLRPRDIEELRLPRRPDNNDAVDPFLSQHHLHPQQRSPDQRYIRDRFYDEMNAATDLSRRSHSYLQHSSPSSSRSLNPFFLGDIPEYVDHHWAQNQRLSAERKRLTSPYPFSAHGLFPNQQNLLHHQQQHQQQQQSLAQELSYYASSMIPKTSLLMSSTPSSSSSSASYRGAESEGGFLPPPMPPPSLVTRTHSETRSLKYDTPPAAGHSRNQGHNYPEKQHKAQSHDLTASSSSSDNSQSHDERSKSREEVSADDKVTHFKLGSLIRLSNGDLKKVEDLTTEDFIQSAKQSADIQVIDSTVSAIEKADKNATVTFLIGKPKLKVSVEADGSHPFFVIGQGWSSIEPVKSLDRYQLPCKSLKVGDVCISLTNFDYKSNEDLLVMPPPSSNSSISSSSSASSASGVPLLLKRKPASKTISEQQCKSDTESKNCNQKEQKDSIQAEEDQSGDNDLAKEKGEEKAEREIKIPRRDERDECRD